MAGPSAAHVRTEYAPKGVAHETVGRSSLEIEGSSSCQGRNFEEVGKRHLFLPELVVKICVHRLDLKRKDAKHWFSTSQNDVSMRRVRAWSDL